MWRGPTVAAVVASVTLAAVSCSSDGGSSSAGSVSATSTTPVVVGAEDYDPANFDTTSATVDNEWFPLTPGTFMAWEGQAFDDGEKIARRVELTVTDLVKDLDGVSVAVILERDFNDGELAEQELAFFAQDAGGNVWLFGEYPEEYEGTKIVKTPAWIQGVQGAVAGLAMKASPVMEDANYAQGWAPKIGWNDRAVVSTAGEATCTPVDCFEDVLVMREFNRDQPGASQLKYYASGTGTVRVGWAGPNEEEREEMDLVEHEQLGADELAEIRTVALDQETRAYDLSAAVYGDTVPMQAMT